jgi:hypothetical protein
MQNQNVKSQIKKTPEAGEKSEIVNSKFETPAYCLQGQEGHRVGN